VQKYSGFKTNSVVLHVSKENKNIVFGGFGFYDKYLAEKFSRRGSPHKVERH
jgi:hypothetical protein